MAVLYVYVPQNTGAFYNLSGCNANRLAEIQYWGWIFEIQVTAKRQFSMLMATKKKGAPFLTMRSHVWTTHHRSTFRVGSNPSKRVDAIIHCWRLRKVRADTKIRYLLLLQISGWHTGTTVTKDTTLSFVYQKNANKIYIGTRHWLW